MKDLDTDEVLKYGETTMGESRYTKDYLKDNNAYMDFQESGTKKDMHTWQHDKIVEYEADHDGKRPPLNKSDY